jgi:hypothetical protein
MAGQLKLYVFGDQTYDIQPRLKDLLRNRNNPVLEDFLVKAYDAIRMGIYNLPREVREDLPRFTCVDDLVLWDQTGKRCVPLDMAVTCMYQLGTFIRYAPEENALNGMRNSRILICIKAKSLVMPVPNNPEFLVSAPEHLQPLLLAAAAAHWILCRWLSMRSLWHLEQACLWPMLQTES